MTRIYALILAAALAASSCATVAKVGSNVLSAVIKCADVQDLAISLIPVVETLIATRGDGWEDELTRVGKEKGEDALACAVREVRRTSFASSKAAPSDGLSYVKTQRAQQYIETRGYTFAD